jgi:hypothetical protein
MEILFRKIAKQQVLGKTMVSENQLVVFNP